MDESSGLAEADHSSSDTSFASFNLAPELKEAIAGVGYVQPTPVQKLMIPPGLAGSDLIVKAQTGSGKTAAFLITMAQRLLSEGRNEQQGVRGASPDALIICPVRELAKQIAAEANELANWHKLSALAVYGGTPLPEQIADLNRRKPPLVVGTPGRLLDLWRRGELALDKLKCVVIDEADRMLDLGFIGDVSNLVFNAPKGRSTYFLSATFPKAIREMAQRWTKGAVEISVEGDSDTIPESVDQQIYTLRAQQRMTVVKNMLGEVLQADKEGGGEDGDLKAIIFANRRDTVDRLYDDLTALGLKVARLSGALRQDRREKTLQRFHDGKLQVIVATDVAGRGIHVEGVTHVINYDLPEDPDAYVHRVGRTGRMGKSGISISFATENDAYVLLDIEEQLGMRLNISEIPAQYLAGYAPAKPGKNRTRRGHSRNARYSSRSRR